MGPYQSVDYKATQAPFFHAPVARSFCVPIPNATILEFASSRYASPREAVHSASSSSKSPNAFTMTRTLMLALFDVAQYYDLAVKVRVY